MIVVTGGAGFIGSAFVAKLNAEGHDDIIIVDELGRSEKWKNLVKRRYADYIHKGAFLEMVVSNRVPFPVEAIVHMGACSSTTEQDADYLMENNFHYTSFLADWALARGIRFVYASSAATYGDGSQGFSDDDETTRSSGRSTCTAIPSSSSTSVSFGRDCRTGWRGSSSSTSSVRTSTTRAT